MIDAMEDKLSSEDEENDDQSDKNGKWTQEIKRKTTQLDLTTLAATALVLLFAGYDTTGITLGYVAYMLALHPEVQDRLCEEVDRAFADNGGQIPGYTEIQGREISSATIDTTTRTVNVMVRCWSSFFKSLPHDGHCG